MKNKHSNLHSSGLENKTINLPTEKESVNLSDDSSADYSHNNSNNDENSSNLTSEHSSAALNKEQETNQQPTKFLGISIIEWMILLIICSIMVSVLVATIKQVKHKTKTANINVITLVDSKYL